MSTPLGNATFPSSGGFESGDLEVESACLELGNDPQNLRDEEDSIRMNEAKRNWL